MRRPLRTLAPARAVSTLVVLVAATRSASGQPEPEPAPAPGPEVEPRSPRAPESPPASAAPTGEIAPPAPTEPKPREPPPVKVTPQGYIEAYYAWNFNRPSNRITNFRGFDNRHDSFSLTNAALGATFESGPVGGKVLLQIGSTPSTYYLSEPALAGSGGANATGPELWKYLQEAFVTFKAPVGRGLLLQAGLCASPIGAEVFAVKDNYNWSRSNLFFGFPFYHAGVRATYEWTDEWSATVSVFNGWNNVVDDNEEKSLQANVTYKPTPDTSVTALYFGGVERPTGSIEGPYWRHHFDVYAQGKLSSLLSGYVQGDYGWEPNRVGTARWWAVAAVARATLIDKRLFFALRGDRFTEHLATDAEDGGRSSSPLFWGGAEWVSSGTATIDLRAHDQVSFRFEYRHDVAEAPLYFKDGVEGDGSAQRPFVANARTQDTALAGATAWF
jgi:hypothetical protein